MAGEREKEKTSWDRVVNLILSGAGVLITALGLAVLNGYNGRLDRLAVAQEQALTEQRLLASQVNELKVQIGRLEIRSEELHALRDRLDKYGERLLQLERARTGG